MRHIKIIIEGLPRSGKTTVAAMLTNLFVGRNHQVNYIAGSSSMMNHFKEVRRELATGQQPEDKEPMLINLYERDSELTTELPIDRVQLPRSANEARAMIAVASNFLSQNKG